MDGRISVMEDKIARLKSAVLACMKLPCVVRRGRGGGGAIRPPGKSSEDAAEIVLMAAVICSGMAIGGMLEAWLSAVIHD